MSVERKARRQLQGVVTSTKPDQTITANTWHIEKKMPWPTLTRRMQFYIDHDVYLELGEELPTHKDAPAIGGNAFSDQEFVSLETIHQ